MLCAAILHALTSIAVPLFFLCLAGQVLYLLFLLPLARVPKAHWTCDFGSFWILWHRYKGPENEMRVISIAHKRYGPVVRLGPSEISVNSLDLSVRRFHGARVEKSGWYLPFKNFGLVLPSSIDIADRDQAHQFYE